MPSRQSTPVYVPCAVSSFFEIFDRNQDGSEIKDIRRIGARGGGFVIQRGTLTVASEGSSIQKDSVIINENIDPHARTTHKVVELMRTRYAFGPVLISHKIEPLVGLGFGTSGSGAIGCALSISDLFKLKLTLAQASEFAHAAEVQSLTGLGTVVSLTSGSGAIGLVTEPGSYTVGRVDSILSRESDYTLVCACFGSVEKATVLRDEKKRQRVNEYGRATLDSVLEDPTPESLLDHSRVFAENTGIASKELLELADKAKQIGAIGATQNMIGNALHCLVRRENRQEFLRSFYKIVPQEQVFESELIQSGPKFVEIN